MTPKTKLVGPRITRKGDTSPHFTPPPLKMMAGGKQCAPRSTITPSKTCSAIFYRRIKRRLGHSLKQSHCMGNLIPSRKQATYELSGTEGGLPGPKRVPRPLSKQHSFGSHGQYYSGCLHKQRRGDEIGPSVCPSVENSNLVYQQIGYSQSPTHPRSAERGSRQAIQARTDNSNRMVSPSRSLPGNLQQVATTPNRPFCNKVQQQVSPVCVTSAGPPSLGGRCTQSALGES